MCRSSRLTFFVLGLALLPSAAARAQFYGFPSEFGVIDDGFGVLPPLPPAQPAGYPGDAGPPPPVAAFPPAPQPCPLVIRVGPGLRHAAPARVIYGRPACS